jgi:hypothetical protein
VVPPHTQGPFLHTHDFDEAFYVIDGELIRVGTGDLAFARRIAKRSGEEPPEWALQPTPQVIRVGPRIGE